MRALVGRGLLLQDGGGAVQAGWAEPDDRPCVVRDVAVPTRFWPSPLAADLSAWAGTLGRVENGVRLWVVDDRGPRDPVPPVVPDAGLIQVLTRRDALRRWSGHARRAGVERELNFALGGSAARGGVSVGACRNLLLLTLRGRTLLMTDDDVQPGPTRGTDTAIRIGGGPGWVTSALAIGEPARGDAAQLHAAHESMLGRRLAAGPAAISACGGAGPLDLERDGLDIPATVVATQAGLIGHPGWGGGLPILLAAGPLAAELSHDEVAYLRFLEQPSVCCNVAEVRVSLDPALMTYHCALDNRSPLPPFPPTFRGEDAVFSSSLRACRPGACSAALTAACVHRPRGSRGIGLDWATRAAEAGANDVLAMLIRAWRRPFGVRDPWTLMRRLAEYLEYLSRAGGGLEERVSLLTAENAARAAASVGRRLAAAGRPCAPAWRRDAETALRSLQRRAGSPWVAPVEWTNEPDQGRGAFREYVLGYAGLLRAWEALDAIAGSSGEIPRSPLE